MELELGSLTCNEKAVFLTVAGNDVQETSESTEFHALFCTILH